MCFEDFIADILEFVELEFNRAFRYVIPGPWLDTNVCAKWYNAHYCYQSCTFRTVARTRKYCCKRQDFFFFFFKRKTRLLESFLNSDSLSRWRWSGKNPVRLFLCFQLLATLRVESFSIEIIVHSTSLITWTFTTRRSLRQLNEFYSINSLISISNISLGFSIQYRVNRLTTVCTLIILILFIYIYIILR